MKDLKRRRTSVTSLALGSESYNAKGIFISVAPVRLDDINAISSLSHVGLSVSSQTDSTLTCDYERQIRALCEPFLKSSQNGQGDSLSHRPTVTPTSDTTRLAPHTHLFLRGGGSFVPLSSHQVQFAMLKPVTRTCGRCNYNQSPNFNPIANISPPVPLTSLFLGPESDLSM